MTRATISIATIALLTACTAGPPSAPNAGPGPQLVNPADAGALFAQICVANLPRFAGAPGTIAGLPFTQNAGTGTYYHNQLNLSVNLNSGDCSMVFFTTSANPGDGFVEGAERTGITGAGTADLSARQFNGATVINARLPQQ